jgi:hypothetical protein
VRLVEWRVVDGLLGGKDARHKGCFGKTDALSVTEPTTQPVVWDALHAQRADELDLLHSHAQKRQIDVSDYPQYTRGTNRTHVLRAVAVYRQILASRSRLRISKTTEVTSKRFIATTEEL